MAEPQEFHVFLSHNSRDKDSIRIIAEQLEQEGFMTWLDETQFKGGDEWQKELYEVLDKTDIAFFFIGINGVGPWQNEEIDYLHRLYISSGKQDIVIVPVFLPGANMYDVPSHLNYLNKFQSVSISDLLDRSEIDKLLKILLRNKTPKPKSSQPTVSYINLERLLSQGKWREADEETLMCILKVAGRSEYEYLFLENIDNLPRKDIRKIDKLWVKYSNGKFGFSVQQEIYLRDCAGETEFWEGMVGYREYNTAERWTCFCKEVGWYNWLGQLKRYDELTFDDNKAPLGHLPQQSLYAIKSVSSDFFSHLGIENDYSHSNLEQLEKLLSLREWKLADSVTGFHLLQLVGRTNEGWLRVEDIDRLPCDNIHRINKLWLKYSNERFGFSVQKEIYIGTGNILGKLNKDAYKLFVQKVGWKKQRDWGFNGGWLSYNDITFDLAATRGHLPVVDKRLRIIGEELHWRTSNQYDFSLLTHRFLTCGL